MQSYLIVKNVGLKMLGMAFALSLQTAAQAQWVVFDPTSYIQSSITAAQSIEATAQRATSYVNQLRQYQTMLTNLKQLPSSALELAVGQLTQGQTELVNSMGSLDQLRSMGALSTEVSRVSGSLADGRAAVNALVGLQQSMGGMQAGYSNRFEVARRMNLTWDQYALQEDLQIRYGVAGAANRAQEDIARVDRVKRDYEFAQDMAAKIPQAEGIQQSLALMNTLMNRVVTQLAEVNKGLVSSINGKSPYEVLADQQKKQSDLDSNRNLLKNIQNQQAADEAALQKWRNLK